MVDRTAEAFKLKEMRDYAASVGSLGTPEARLDLEAAGYTPEEIQTTRLFEPEGQVYPKPLPAQTTSEARIEPYTPTLREENRYKISTQLQELGMNKNAADTLADDIVGNPQAMGDLLSGIGLLDFTPMGAAYATQEGYRTVKRGIASGDPLTTGLGALEAGLGVAEAIPLTKPLARGASRVITRMAESYDPNVLGSNLGNVGQAGGKPKRPLVPRFETEQPPADFTFDLAGLKNEFVDEIKWAAERNASSATIRHFNAILNVLNTNDNNLFLDIAKINSSDSSTDRRARAQRIIEKYKDILPEDITKGDLEVLSSEIRHSSNFMEATALGSAGIRFRSPIESVVQQLEYPRDGIKGSQFLKELKDNPDVRDSEVAGIGLDIDPQKRYTQQELMDAVSGRLYDVTVQYKDNYMSYQRQRDVGFDDSRQIDYFELVINAEPRGDNPGFKANSQHYGKNTLAHTRGSVQEDSAGEYIFVEEMQSDLLQKGFDESPRGPSPDDVYSQFQIRPRESTIEGVIKASPEEIQKGMSMAVLREEMEKLTGGDFQSADDTLQAFTAKSTEGEWASYMLFRTIHIDYLQYDPNVPVEVAKEAFNDIKDYITKNSVVKLNPPPIAKTEESVRLTIDALMAEGQTRGVSRIVIPPLEKIVEARFNKGSGSYKKALDPKSGFYATYVTSVNKVLDKYKKEFGDDFVVNDIELSYNNDKLQGTEIDFSGLINKNYNLTRPRFAQGGMVDYNTEIQMNRLMQEGGIADDGMRRDPVSGNEIPPGSMATEVRDDIPAQLSEGEYIVPADVLRYYGVAFFEQLRAKAKRGLAEMEAGGRIGGEPVEMEDEDELPFDISELETAGDDTDMQMSAMGMAKGGVVKMQEGGMPVATSSFNPANWATPGSSYFQQTGAQQQSEYRVYQNAQGQTISILFINGVAQQPIPEGFFPQGQGPKVEQPTPADRGDRDETPQPPQKSFNEYTAEDWMKYKPDTGVGSTIGKIAGGVIGGALLGPAGAMIGGKMAEEGMARNTVSAYNALNDYVATLSRNDPNYGELAEKRNKMYGDLTAAQQENPGFFGNLFNSIFGKPEIAQPKSGTAAKAATTTGGGVMQPEVKDSDSGIDIRPETIRKAAEATGAGAKTRVTQDQKLGAGAREGGGTTTTARPAPTSTAAAARSYRESADEQYGALAKGGLMMKKSQSKKSTQKRNIKTVST